MNSSPEKIVLTGATGFVGKAVLKELGSELEITTPNLRTTRPAEIDFYNVQAVVHCAALVHQMQGAPREDYFRINTDLTQALALAAKAAGVGHFIFLSTSHVYGEYGDCFNHERLLSETDPCHPTDPYGESKVAAEKLLLDMQTENFAVSIIRSPMIYGEGAKGNLLSLCKLIQAIPVLPFGEKENRRSLIYVGNLVHFIRKTLEKKPRGLLLAQDERPLSISEIVSYLGDAIGKKVHLFPLPRFIFRILYNLKPNIMKRLYGTLAMDSTATVEKLDYRAPVSSREGFRRMIVGSPVDPPNAGR